MVAVLLRRILSCCVGNVVIEAVKYKLRQQYPDDWKGTRSEPSSHPHRLPRFHSPKSLRHRRLLRCHRLLDPPKQFRVAQRYGILPCQFLDLLNCPLDDPLAGTSERSQTHQRFRLAARHSHIENGDTDLAQPPADESPEFTDNR